VWQARQDASGRIFYVNHTLKETRWHPPTLVGADASHAWLAAWGGDAGWLDVDPTNDCVVGDRHVTVAWGRDYGDVCPIRGVFVGGGQHGMDVAVHVTRCQD
jgi:transglutaminase-like putative cysteine protease